jgi:predicted AAA+ superfamily ATPase
MEEAQLIRVIRKKNDHKIYSIGAKIFLHDPSAYAAFQGDLGSVREAVTVTTFQESGRKVLAATDDSQYDFIVDGKHRIEIGGPSKARKKADFVVRDRIDVPVDNVIPLWTLGFMY